MFRRNISPPTSGLESTSCKKPAETGEKLSLLCDQKNGRDVLPKRLAMNYTTLQFTSPPWELQTQESLCPLPNIQSTKNSCSSRQNVSIQRPSPHLTTILWTNYSSYNSSTGKNINISTLERAFTSLWVLTKESHQFVTKWITMFYHSIHESWWINNNLFEHSPPLAVCLWYIYV
jgi:hypothetical protein